MRRVAPDEKRVERQRHAQARVTDAGGGMAIDGPVGAQLHEARQLADQIHQLVHRAAAQPLEAELVARLAVLEELLVARHVARAEAADLVDHRLFILPDGKDRAVAPADLVIGIDRAQIDIGGKVAAAFGPELLEHLRHGHDGRAKVEAVAVLRDRRSAPARPVEPVQQRHPVALGAQPHRGGQPAKPRPDHDRAGGAGGGRSFGHTQPQTV